MPEKSNFGEGPTRLKSQASAAYRPVAHLEGNLHQNHQTALKGVKDNFLNAFGHPTEGHLWQRVCLGFIERSKWLGRLFVVAVPILNSVPVSLGILCGDAGSSFSHSN